MVRKSVRLFALVLGLTASLAAESARAVDCEVISFPIAKPRCLCATVEARCDGATGWLNFSSVPADKRVAGARFFAASIELYDTNADLAAHHTLGAGAPQPISCRNPRFHSDSAGHPWVNLLRIPGCVETCSAEVICDPAKGAPKNARPEVINVICGKKANGRCKPADECVAEGRKVVGLGVAQDSTPAAGQPRLTLRSEPLASEPYQRFGVFAGVLPEGACGANHPIICAEWGDYIDSSGGTQAAMATCAQGEGGHCQGINNCAADSRIDSSTRADLSEPGAVEAHGLASGSAVVPAN